jgi:hypothetical protein
MNSCGEEHEDGERGAALLFRLLAGIAAMLFELVPQYAVAAEIKVLTFLSSQPILTQAVH